MQEQVTFDNLRKAITTLLGRVDELAEGVGSPAIQEIILAKRHIEDARMRLGVAATYQKGQDPWETK